MTAQKIVGPASCLVHFQIPMRLSRFHESSHSSLPAHSELCWEIMAGPKKLFPGPKNTDFGGEKVKFAGPKNIFFGPPQVPKSLKKTLIIITTSCMWHAVLQLHQLLYRYMTLYITPERTGLTPCRYYAAAVQCHAIRGSLKDFGRRRRPKCDARLAQKAQK